MLTLAFGITGAIIGLSCFRYIVRDLLSGHSELVAMLTSYQHTR